MKKVIKAISASAIIVLAGCSMENMAPEVQEQQTRNVIVNAGPVATKVNFTDDGTSKVEVKWNAEGEAFSAFIGNAADAAVVPFEQVSAPDAAGSVQFSGNIPAETSAETMVYAIYPKRNIESGNPNGLAINLTNQTGDFNEAKSFMYASASLADLENPSYSLQFKHITSVVKLTLDFGAAISGNASDVSIYANNILRTAYVNLATGEVTKETTSRIRFNGEIALEDGKAVVCFHVAPASLDDMTIRATVGDKSYVGTLTGKKVESGKLYNVEAAVVMGERKSGLTGYTNVILAMQKYTQNTAYHFLSAPTKTRFTVSTAAENSADIDIVGLYSSTNGCSLVSPHVDNATAVYGTTAGTAAWAVRNVTTFKILTAEETAALDYANTKTAAQVEEIFNSASGADNVYRAFKLAKDSYVAFQTATGRYGIMQLLSVAGNNSGLMKFNYKISE